MTVVLPGRALAMNRLHELLRGVSKSMASTDLYELPQINDVVQVVDEYGILRRATVNEVVRGTACETAVTCTIRFDHMNGCYPRIRPFTFALHLAGIVLRQWPLFPLFSL